MQRGIALSDILPQSLAPDWQKNSRGLSQTQSFLQWNLFPGTDLIQRWEKPQLWTASDSRPTPSLEPGQHGLRGKESGCFPLLLTQKLQNNDSGGVESIQWQVNLLKADFIEYHLCMWSSVTFMNGKSCTSGHHVIGTTTIFAKINILQII